MRMNAALLKKYDQLDLLAHAALFNRAVKDGRAKGDRFEFTIKKASDLVDLDEVEKLIYGDEEDDKTFQRLHQITQNVKNYKKSAKEGDK